MRSFNEEIFEISTLEWGFSASAAVLLFLLASVGLLDTLSLFFSNLTVSTRADLHMVSQDTGEFFQGISALPELIDENRTLEAENLRLQSELAQVEFVFKENERLAAEVGITYDRDYDQVGVKVISRNPSEPAIVLVNKGSDSGIKVGDVAVIESILLGEVTDVTPSTAKITLLVNASSQLPVKTQSENIGLLVGHNGRELLVTQILQSKQLDSGDLVYSSGVDNRFPSDLFIGEIASVSNDERASTKEAEITPLVDWDSLSEFKILLK